MRWTEAFIPTLKEDPQDAEVISHKLMVRAGLIRKLTAGAYSYLPLGFKVLQKIQEIIREEMDKKGAQQVLLPALHPSDLWKKTGRYELLGEDMIKFNDRHHRELILGPTHEEIITDLVAKEIRSYKDLPLILYQIQTKFRDETRPRFGVIRSCEFIMKDAYSFDKDWEGLDKSYKKMYDAYCRIFERCGLQYIAVEADTGIMGGDASHEFMVPSNNGEDIIALCTKCSYAASLDVARYFFDKKEAELKYEKQTKDPMKSFKAVLTPGVSSVEKVSEFLKIKPNNLVKTLIYQYDGGTAAVLVNGSYNLNEKKIKKFLKTETLAMATADEIFKLTGGPIGFSGPVGLKKEIKIFADYSINQMLNFVVGANKKDQHLINVNLKDFNIYDWSDFRCVEKNDPCPLCKSHLSIQHSIEVGHTFKLGTKYSMPLKATFLDFDGKEKPAIMGCYGIGINRVMASAIEQNNDKDGIIWPFSIAPFQVAVIPTDIENAVVLKTSDEIYEKCISNNIDAIIDNRPERAGIKFKDSDLVGIPIQIILGNKFKNNGEVEIKRRIALGNGKIQKDNISIPTQNISEYIKSNCVC